jgi:asparagine synthase (glutamine-hydrolysing)
MCGICGVIQVGGEPREVIAPEALDHMTDVMSHRGPNDRGTYSAPGVALGVRRLSIVDVEGGHQPFASEDQAVWAIQNGELYNHVDLRAELGDGGHRFATRCDTEILPHSYEQWGERFPRRLRGKFGIAVWDGRRRRAVLARDRLGVKPLYFARSGNLLVFASELKSLLASGLVQPALDYRAIDAYLTFGFFPGPWTPLEGVRKLLPGHVLVVETGDVRIEPYWTYPAPAADMRRGRRETAEELMEKLEEAVRLRLMSDVPLGAMLSGGLDSSLVVALMAKNMAEPVKTFSVGFVEDGDINELADARFVADHFGTDHHELELSIFDTDVSIENLVWHSDEPLADLSTLGLLALCELAAKHVTVGLSGQGADELLAGYTKHRAAAFASMWRRLPPPFRQLGTAFRNHGPAQVRRMSRALAAGDAADRLVAMSGKLGPELKARLYRGPLAAVDGTAARAAVLARLDGAGDDPLPTTLFIDAQLALVDDMLHYFDRASMAHSLELRVPFLDHELVEYCATIPPGWKATPWATKRLLKEAARGVIPDRIIDKRKIGFFAGSVDRWFQAQSETLVRDYLLAPDARYREFLDPAGVEGLIAEHRTAGDRAMGSLLLSILMLEVWLRTYVPRALAAPVPNTARVRVPA